jgi:hypothetical protein
MNTLDLLPSKDDIAEALRQLTVRSNPPGHLLAGFWNLRRRDCHRRRTRGPVRAEAGRHLVTADLILAGAIDRSSIFSRNDGPFWTR